MRAIYRTLVLAAALTAVGAAGCDESDDNDTPDEGGNGRDGGSGGSRDGGTDGGASGSDGGTQRDGATDDIDGGEGRDAGGGDAAVSDLTDPQIAAVTSTANAGEIAQAMTARPKLTNPDVQAFADMMVMMHTAAQQRQATLLMQKGITPQENPESTALKQESDAIVAQLTAAPAPVDVLYIDAQVTVHEKVLTKLDTLLIPSAEDAQLKADLTTARGEVNAHLTRAREIKTALSADAGK